MVTDPRLPDPPPPPPPPGGARLVSAPGTAPTLTLRQESDARTAACRGLKEYVEQLEWAMPGGRLLRFARVLDTWASAEVEARYPSAIVEAGPDGDYDAARFTPVAEEDRVEGRVLVQTCEFRGELRVGVWATDSKERAGLVAMLESRLMAPTLWMFGTMLELPHYFGVRATYEPVGVSYDDSSENALRRHRVATVRVRCSMPMVAVTDVPTLAVGQPKFSAEVSETQEFADGEQVFTMGRMA